MCKNRFRDLVIDEVQIQSIAEAVSCTGKYLENDNTLYKTLEYLIPQNRRGSRHTRNLEIFWERVATQKTLREIAFQFNLSRPRVYIIIANILNLLRKL